MIGMGESKKVVENPKIGDVIYEKNQKQREDNYNKYVKNLTPTNNCWLDVCKAFLVGGIICTIGQAILNYYIHLGVEKEAAIAYNNLTLILASIILTGFNVYPTLAKFGGAGTVVPITGFANSVVAPAIEYKKEGQVFGIGCKIFTIAGPVILYGILSTWILGLIYWILKLLHVVG